MILHSPATTLSPPPAIHPLLAQHFTPHSSTRPYLFLPSAFTPFTGIIHRDVKDGERLAIEAILRDGRKLDGQNNYPHSPFSAAEFLTNPTLEGGRFKQRTETASIGGPLVYHTRLYKHCLSSLLRDKSAHDPNVETTRLILFDAKTTAVAEDPG